jgi:hypothetical protein
VNPPETDRLTHSGPDGSDGTLTTSQHASVSTSIENSKNLVTATVLLVRRRAA